ncbi:MAG: terminase large subunit [Gallionella sp.]|nr:terminase large subunit [Gallionella sp.]
MPTANRPQCEFLSMPNKYRAMVGGFGSSKTWTGCMAMAAHHWEHPRINAGYFAPTYPMIRDIFYPTMEEVASDFGLRVDVKEGNKEVHFYSGRQYRGTTICRSMENPNVIIGFKIGYALIDEFDMLEPRKAHNAWRKIIARMRYNDASLKNGVDVVTTPEGFRATHKLFVADVAEKPELAKNYGLLQVSTYDNEANLPEEYIPSLFEAYTKELVAAYIDGQFVNLTSGTVYRSYDRKRCDSHETIKTPVKDANGKVLAEPLFIGMDFNVTKMAASVAVQRPNGWHYVAELKDVFDTPDMVKIVKERWADQGHRIIVYPDPTGKNRETVDASKSDIALLEQAGFTVRAENQSPSIKDRVNATNKQIEIGCLHVNARACPTIVKCLEQQSYDDNGEPDKKSGFDHQNDATSYPMAYEFPIKHDRAQRIQIGGV